MNMNPSQFLRTVSSLVFILFFAGIAQASIFQKIARNLPDVPRSKIEKIADFFEGWNINTNNLSENDLRELAHAWDDPTHLIKPSPDGFFGSSVHRDFFFFRFDLQKDGDALFTQLFSKKNGEKLEELPFEQAKRNWDHFLDEIQRSDWFLSLTMKSDLGAAAMSFVHKRFSDKYFPDKDLDPRLSGPATWEEQSLGTFFHNQFNIHHYTSAHFTLTPENPYHHIIMTRISVLSSSLGSINSKEFVLKIWKDVTEEISIQERPGISSSVFLGRIVDSIIEFRNLSGSIRSQPFLKAMIEAARENDRLVELFNIVNRFATDTHSNPENYRQYLLEQFRNMPSGRPRSEIDQVIRSFLSQTDLEDFISQHTREEGYWRNALRHSEQQQSNPQNS